MRTVKLFLSDVDGCMTDGGLYYMPDGTEFKRFCVYDGVGLVMLRKAGIPCGILTSELNPLVEHRAKNLQLDYLYLGVGRMIDHITRTKVDVAKEICVKEGITLQDVCYLGDDLNDYDLLSLVGTPVCPVNAQPKIKSIPNILCLDHCGGSGAVREIADRILGTYEPDK